VDEVRNLNKNLQSETFYARFETVTDGTTTRVRILAQDDEGRWQTACSGFARRHPDDDHNLRVAFLVAMHRAMKAGAAQYKAELKRHGIDAG
jgi:hypothetical protein